MTLSARDAVALAGLVLLTVGSGWAYLPAGPIVLGSALLAAALWGYHRDREETPHDPGDDPGKAPPF